MAKSHALNLLCLHVRGQEKDLPRRTGTGVSQMLHAKAPGQRLHCLMCEMRRGMGNSLRARLKMSPVDTIKDDRDVPPPEKGFQYLFLNFENLFPIPKQPIFFFF